MTVEAVESVVVDQPVFFPPDEKTYFGLVSVPVPAKRRTTGVILLSGTHAGSTTMGRNRIWVTVGRTLADHGFTTLRLDYAGLGESLAGGPIYDLELPAVDAFRKGIALLRSLGMERFIVVGTCFGSRTALAGAADAEDITGVLMLAPPVRNPKKGEGGTSHMAIYTSTGDLAKKAFSMRTVRKLVGTKKARRVARKVVSGKVLNTMGRGPTDADGERTTATEAADGFLTPFRALAQRRVPLRIVYGTDDMFWTEFQRASEGRLGRILEKAGDSIVVDTVPGIVRGFASVRIQEISIETIVSWAESHE